MRLDLYLVEHKGVASREKAQYLIKRGDVLVNGNKRVKASYKVKIDDEVVVKEGIKFVSRSGNKLAAALEAFNIQVKDTICLDIGSSTGGFTDCLLQNGALKVYAVDVGTNQLDKRLLKDKRVKSFEGVDIRTFDQNKIKDDLDIIVVDVSFISIEHILPTIKTFSNKKTNIVLLFKPQFEVGKSNIKKGVVRDEKILSEALEKGKMKIEQSGFKVHGYIKSPIKGKEGNQEYLLVFTRNDHKK